MAVLGSCVLWVCYQGGVDSCVGLAAAWWRDPCWHRVRVRGSRLNPKHELGGWVRRTPLFASEGRNAAQSCALFALALSMSKQVGEETRCLQVRPAAHAALDALWPAFLAEAAAPAAVRAKGRKSKRKAEGTAQGASAPQQRRPSTRPV